LLLSCLLLANCDASSLRRDERTTTTTTEALESMPSSSCNDIKDESTCNASSDKNDEACVWCKCAALPSQCFSMSQSKMVPPSVFQCDSSSLEEVEENLLQYYKIRDAPVDSEFCDPSSSLSLSGYMDVSGSRYDAKGEDKHLFFWFFEKRSQEEEEEEKDDTIPLIVWLTGGPGCSSTLALLTENGPCSVDDEGTSTIVNPYSWTETAHVLWLDQPAGVGFSYGAQTDHNEAMISEDAYYFFQSFFTQHPEYASSPLYIVGESYGGHYAPAVAHRIYVGNQALAQKSSSNLLHLNLSGLGVGNGLTNPQEQYKWYPEMAYNNPYGIHAVNKLVYEAMTNAVPKCTSIIESCNKGDNRMNDFYCQSAFLTCNDALTVPYQLSGLNPYDIRKKCDVKPLCYDFSNVEKFLRLQSTRDALHVKDDSSAWQSCNMGVNGKFHVDWMKDMSPLVADLLEGGIPVLIYAGDVDFICNYMGNRAWTLGLEWSEKEAFVQAEDHDWNDGSGLARTAGGFTFLQVYEAGHMVPSDQPKVALDMIASFVNGDSF